MLSTISERTGMATKQTAKSAIARYFIRIQGTDGLDDLEKKCMVRIFPTIPINTMNAAGTNAGNSCIKICTCSWNNLLSMFHLQIYKNKYTIKIHDGGYTLTL
jgi:hypothetical protein